MSTYTFQSDQRAKTSHAVLLICDAIVQNLATECEIEEEYLVNNLQKRIGKLHLEKGQLEQSLGHLQRKVHCARLLGLLVLCMSFSCTNQLGKHYRWQLFSWDIQGLSVGAALLAVV